MNSKNFNCSCEYENNFIFVEIKAKFPEVKLNHNRKKKSADKNRICGWNERVMKLFRILGFLEGVSFLLLLGVGVPLKYMAANPMWVKALGMPHGLLFIAYLILAFNVYVELDWPKKRLFQALGSALLPLGTFVFDYKYLRHK